MHGGIYRCTGIYFFKSAMKATFHDRKGSCIVTLFTGESARTVTEETMGNITGGTK